MIDISKVSKAEVLKALYNDALAITIILLRGTPIDMTIEQAEELLEKTSLFNCLNYRPMNVDLSGDTLDPCLYDRDNGKGAAARAIANIKPVEAKHVCDLEHETALSPSEVSDTTICKRGNLAIREHFNGFSIEFFRPNEFGDAEYHWRWLSDGVDMMFDTEGEPISPGTTEWWLAAYEWLAHEETLMEVYFPEVET